MSEIFQTFAFALAPILAIAFTAWYLYCRQEQSNEKNE
jgi:hypothetical protein